MTDWNAWIGREQVQRDTLDTALANRWFATFDIEPSAIGMMPQGIHLCLCTPEAPQAALGEDGHPLRDDSEASFFPPIPLPRRMWAASEIKFVEPIAIGADVERTSRIVSESSDNARLFHLPDEATLRAEFAQRELGRERNKWLYSYDPLTVPLI